MIDQQQSTAAAYHYARDAHGRTGYHCANCFDETVIDNRVLREHLRRVAVYHLEAGQREGRRLTAEDLAQLLLTRARALRDLRLEFKLAETHPGLTGGTPAELRARLYDVIWNEARGLAVSPPSPVSRGSVFNEQI
jgi:hypothetical protein